MTAIVKGVTCRAGRVPGRRGFSLVELLVTVSIVALLVSMLTPSLMKAYALTRLQYCKANLKRMLVANQAYASDSKGLKPPIYPLEADDWASPNLKYRYMPTGQGLLLDPNARYGHLSDLLCPGQSMRADADQDRRDWYDPAKRASGSSYAYFRYCPTKKYPVAPTGLRYDDCGSRGQPTLLADINCSDGHKYRGEYEGRAWPSHPLMGKINILSWDGTVFSPKQGLRVGRPGGRYEEWKWYVAINQLTGGKGTK